MTVDLPGGKNFRHQRAERLRLPDGKVELIEPDWVGKLAGFTLLFEALVLMLAQQMPFAAVARIVGESWQTQVYFRRESEPYITLSLAGTRPQAGVSSAEVGLKLVWDLIRHPRVSEHNVAYVLDAQNRIIGHSDMFTRALDAQGQAVDHVDLSLFQRDLSGLAQVQAKSPAVRTCCTCPACGRSRRRFRRLTPSRRWASIRPTPRPAPPIRGTWACRAGRVSTAYFLRTSPRWVYDQL
jgi:hypothetical protein